MSFLGIDLYSGDDEIRTWFLINSDYLPLILCTLFVVFAKWVGPALMRCREPLELRVPMIVFNFLLVGIYASCLSTGLYYVYQLGIKLLCHELNAKKGTITYTLASFAWLAYVLKYVEFIDTLFFILRKKNHLLTNLHLIHHTIMPLWLWVNLRTERSGFQSFPLVVNTFVHILMYSYYGLAAVGPSMKKYLWWKKYLTIAQMIQFVMIFVFAIIVTPLAGCSTTKSSALINITGTMMFFAFFFNFYYLRFVKNEDGLQNHEKEH